MPNSSFEKKYYLTRCWKNEGVHTFPEVNLIAQQEFELAYYDSAVQHFTHYTKGTPNTLSYYYSLSVKFY